MVSLPGLRNRKTVPARTPGELDAMAAAGAVVAAALKTVRAAAAPGVSTKTLDEAAETVIREAGGTPSFLGYHGYPASICSSVNDRVVHGIPSAGETLAPGDLVSIDCGAIIDGWHGDAAITFGIGRQMHMDPFLPNEGQPGRGPHLVVGSVLAIEPMLTLGTTKTRILADEWTVVTSDGSRAAHWEHTVAVTDEGPRILTL